MRDVNSCAVGGGVSAERAARGTTTGAMNLRAVALCAWVASLAHLLILFNRFDVVSPGAAALVATGLLSAIPALWVASAVLLAPGDVRAAVSVLTGRTGSLPVAVPATPESVAMKSMHHLAEDGEWSDLDEANTVSGGAHRLRRQRRGDRSRKATPVARDQFGRQLSPASPSSPLQTHADDASGRGRGAGRNDADRCSNPATPFGSNRNRLSLSSRDSKDATGSALDSADERERLANGLAMKGTHAKGANSDDSEDDGESWRDAVVGIKGMAQALRDANNHVSAVALNADLTVALSTMMLNTLRLFEAAGDRRGGRGESSARLRGGTFEKGAAAAESEPANLTHLENAHEIVKETCALAEPLFDKDTPLVLHNALPPDEVCFLARDTFACCLFALVYRAGTRVVRGSCRLTTERVAAEIGEEERANDGDASSSGVGAFPGSPLAPRAGVRVVMQYFAAATAGGARSRETSSDVSRRFRSRAARDGERAVENEDGKSGDGVRDDAKRLGTSEMRFWRRQLRRSGGSLSVHRERGPGVGIATEHITMWVPTAGSDTLWDGRGERVGVSHVAAPRSVVARGERAAEGEADGDRARGKTQTERRDRRVSLDVVSLASGPTATAAAAAEATPSPAAERAFERTLRREENAAARVAASERVEPLDADRRPPSRSSVSCETGDGADDRFGFAHPDTREDRARRSSGGSSFRDSPYSSYLSTVSADFSILYVEDERVQAYFFINKCKRVFGDRCHVFHETDGVAALERLSRGEQFAVVVSDIFMAGMDGVSFFRTLFDANLNAGAGAIPSGGAPPRLNIVLTGADVDPSRGAEDAELALDLNGLQDTYGVLCYNKTSAVDVVVDVIKPHVAFVERVLKQRLGDAALGEDGVDGSDDDDERKDWIPAAPPTRGMIPETDPARTIEPNERADAENETLAGSAAAENLVARSGASCGAFGRPFPDVSGVRDES